MFIELSDEDFYNEVMDILLEYCSKEHNIQIILEQHFNRSFSSIKKRFKRISFRTIFDIHNKILADKALEMLKEKQCFEVMIELGFKYESNFARWLKTIKGIKPSDLKGGIAVIDCRN